MAVDKVYEYYKRKDVRKMMAVISRKREVAGVYENGGYTKRPDSINYDNDILTMVRRGAIEFHCSIERWKNPMSIRPGNYDEIRDGWDIILDLDCNETSHGKAAAKALKWALNEHGIKNISIKFTGGTGFHIGLPWESFPETVNFEPINNKFPSLPRIIADYIREFTKKNLIKNLEELGSWEDLCKAAGVAIDEVIKGDEIYPWKIVDIDPVLISTRHLFRMPYSLNKKNMLVSIPFDIEKIDEFDKEWAKPENVKTEMGFLDKYQKNEAENLFFKALEWYEKNKEDKPTGPTRERIELTSAVPEEYFPACIKNILEGLSDGRKRVLFILTSFLRSVKWEWEDIESKLMEWNEKNAPPLPRNTIKTHIRNHKRKSDVLPPNCDKDGWYVDVGACEPDECKKYKNPALYVIKTYMEKSKKKARKKRKKKVNIVGNSVIPKDAFS